MKNPWRQIYMMIFFFKKIAHPFFTSPLQKCTLGYPNTNKKNCCKHMFEKCDSNINFPTSKNDKKI
jgi:hypothetical protein